MVIEPVYGDPTREQVDNAWVGTIAGETTIHLSDEAPRLTVHEWGVFCSFTDAAYANLDRKNEWASVPDSFYRQFPDRKFRKVEEWQDQPTEAFKPIIYFYTDRQNLALDVKLAFTDGAPVVWWPCAKEPLDDGKLKPGDVFRQLHWSGKLTVNPARAPGLVDFPRDSWMDKARIDGPALFVTDDQPVRVRPTGTQPLPRIEAGRRISRGCYQMQSGKFIYYDGLTAPVHFVQCVSASAGEITLENSAKFDIAGMIVVDRRDEKSVRAGAAGQARRRGQRQGRHPARAAGLAQARLRRARPRSAGRRPAGQGSRFRAGDLEQRPL